MSRTVKQYKQQIRCEQDPDLDMIIECNFFEDRPSRSSRTKWDMWEDSDDYRSSKQKRKQELPVISNAELNSMRRKSYVTSLLYVVSLIFAFIVGHAVFDENSLLLGIAWLLCIMAGCVAFAVLQSNHIEPGDQVKEHIRAFGQIHWLDRGLLYIANSSSLGMKLQVFAVCLLGVLEHDTPFDVLFGIFVIAALTISALTGILDSSTNTGPR